MWKRWNRNIRTSVTCGLIALLFSSGAALAQNKYYMMIWAFDGKPEASLFDTDHWGHTFATYARVDVEGTARSLVETHSISWLPKPLVMNPLNGTLPGHNYTLSETFQVALMKHLVLSRSGPWPIPAEYFATAATESERLSSPSHADRYVMLDQSLRPGASNCYDKIADVAGTDGAPFSAFQTSGVTASVLLLRWLVQHRRLDEFQDSTALWLKKVLLEQNHLMNVNMSEFTSTTRVFDFFGRER